MRRILVLLACTILTLPALDGTALPGGSGWILQVDLRRLLDGGLGPWLREQAAAPTIRPRLALLRNLTGIDALTDIDRITLIGPDARESEAVLVLVGRFDRAKLELVAEASAGHRSEPLRSHLLHRMHDTQRGRDTWAALAAGERVLVAGARRETVAAALDALDRAGAALDPARFAIAGAPLDAPLIAAATGVDAWIGSAPDAQLLRSISGIALTIGEAGDDLVLRGDLAALDEGTGGDLASIVEGFLALARLSPDTRRDPAWHALVSTAKLSRQGAGLALTARTPRLVFQRSAESHIAAALAREAGGK